MALAFIGPIADLTELVKAHCASQVIAQLALIQDSSHSASQLEVQELVEHEQPPFDAAEPRGARGPDRSDVGSRRARSISEGVTVQWLTLV
jgi:hypothetical protein